VAVGPEQDNRVMKELQPGYKFGDRLLQPARVRVGRVSD
jgi:molecular chaperone GrpE (heat shock protein)